jgi:L-aspartate oxidase
METVVFGKRVVEHITAGGGGAAERTSSVERTTAPAGSVPRHAELQALMWDTAGIERDAGGMERGIAALDAWPQVPLRKDRDSHERRQMTVVASLMLRAAHARTESRGAHYRNDFPNRDDAHWRRQQVWVRDD